MASKSLRSDTICDGERAQVRAYLGQFRCWQAKVAAVTLDLFGLASELFKLLALFGDNGCKLSAMDEYTTDI